jgi:hypothetical protein
MSEYRTISINSLQKQIQQIEQDPSIGDVIYTNLDTLARCVDSIFRHNGDPSWVADVRDATGQPVFKPTEYERIHEAVSVFFPMLYTFFGKQYEQSMQRGGDGEEIPTGVPVKTQTQPQAQPQPQTSTPSNQNIQKLQNTIETQKKELTNLKQRLSTGSTTDDSESTSMGVDALYRKVVDMLGQFNSSVVNFASTYGILKLEKSFDNELDPKPFLPLASVPGLQPLAQVPVPIRVIVLFLYTCLDIARVMISISPTDRPFIRKVLSIVTAVVDILRGDWKKALLSFSSYFSSDYAIMSVIGKVILDVGGLISPYLQYHMTYGLLDVSKSILAGLLLSLFQTFAPYPVRQPVLEQIEVMRGVADENKKQLEESIANPEQRELYASFLVPSFEQIQTLQSVFINDELQCDPRVETAMHIIVGKPGNENIFMKIVLELLGVPIDPEEMARKCPPTPERFGEAVAKDAMEKASGNTVVTPTTAQQMEQVAENPEAVPDVNPVSNTNEEQSQPQPTQKPTQKPTQQLNNDNPT